MIIRKAEKRINHWIQHPKSASSDRRQTGREDIYNTEMPEGDCNCRYIENNLEDSKINMGEIYENFVAQELNSHRYPTYFYCSHNQGELDFVIEHDGTVLPIEVKSGKDYYAHSAISKTVADAEYEINEAYVLTNCNVEVRNQITYLPVYMCAFLNEEVQCPVLSLVSVSLVLFFTDQRQTTACFLPQIFCLLVFYQTYLRFSLKTIG